jgi:hypothetical protein
MKMVTKSKAGQKKASVKVGKLKVNKDTVKNLSVDERRKIKGGQLCKASVGTLDPVVCPTVVRGQ